MKRLIATMGIVLLLAGCADGTGPVGDEPRIMTDSKGARYLVQHHIGNTYTVQRIEE